MSRDLYLKHLGSLQALDQQIGELAAYLGEIADALTDEPCMIAVGARSRLKGNVTALTPDLWPTYESMSKLLGKRCRLDLKVRSVWSGLKRAERAGLTSPLKRTTPNRLKPLL